MDQKQQMKTNQTTSKLEQLSLGFEYDKTLQQLKRDMRLRTL